MAGASNYYQSIGIEPHTSHDEIAMAIRATRKRYRQLVGSPDQRVRLDAEQQLLDLSEAEDILLDPVRRKAYDQELFGVGYPVPQAQGSALTPRVDHWVQEGWRYYQTNAMDSARKAAEYALKLDEQHTQAWELDYRAALAQQDLEGAFFAMDQLFRLDPTRIDLLSAKIRIYYEYKSYDLGYNYCKEVIARAQSLGIADLAWWEISCADLCFRSGKRAEGLNQIASMVMKYPNDSRVKVNYSENLIADAWDHMDRYGDTFYISDQSQVDYLDKVFKILNNLDCEPVLKGSSFRQLKSFYDDMTADELMVVQLSVVLLVVITLFQIFFRSDFGPIPILIVLLVVGLLIKSKKIFHRPKWVGIAQRIDGKRRSELQWNQHQLPRNSTT